MSRATAPAGRGHPKTEFPAVTFRIVTEARRARKRSRTMGREGLRQRLGVGFDRHRPLSWGSPRELKKKARYRYRYLDSCLGIPVTNKQSLKWRKALWSLICGAANCSLIGQVCGGRDGMAADCGRCRLASRSPSLRPIWPANVWALIRFLQTASAVQHFVCCADFLKKINERYANDPKCGFLYERRNVAAPAAVAPAAEPSVRSDESEKKKLKVSREKGPFSTLANAGIKVCFKSPRLNHSFAKEHVLVRTEALGTDQALEYAYLTVNVPFGKLGRQELSLRLLSVKQEQVFVLEELINMLGRFRSLDWPFADTAFEIRFYTFLCTLPGCPAQDEHLDHTDVRLWSLIVCIGLCIREVRFIVDGKEFSVILNPGDAVLFRGTLCHFGGPSGTKCRCRADDPCRAEPGKKLSVNLRCVELALHCYVVVKMPELKLPPFDWVNLGESVFGCPHP